MEAEGVRTSSITGNEKGFSRSYPTKCKEMRLFPSSFATSLKYLWKYKNI